MIKTHHLLSRKDQQMWQCIHFSVDEIASGKKIQLQGEFEQSWMSAEAPRDAAMFSSFLDDQGLDVYFTPAAAKVAPAVLARYRAKQCDKPAGQLAILIAHAGLGIQDFQ